MGAKIRLGPTQKSLPSEKNPARAPCVERLVYIEIVTLVKPAMLASVSPSAQLFFLFASFFIALLLTLALQGELDPERARAMAMAAGAMTQAACYAARGRIPTARVDATVRAVLNLNPRGAEHALNGAGSVAWGLRRFLRLAAKPFAEPCDEPVLYEMNRFIRLARRLRRDPRLESGFSRDLQRIGALSFEQRRPALAHAMNRLAQALGEGEGVEGDRALAWLYGLRAAWLWRSLGGWRSPLAYVPRAITRAAVQVVNEVVRPS